MFENAETGSELYLNTESDHILYRKETMEVTQVLSLYIKKS